ncbi:MAG TPA: hypothetical protein VGG25_16020 [Streptosporangiaceae bacterium]|jgi:hypothetical protein
MSVSDLAAWQGAANPAGDLDEELGQLFDLSAAAANSVESASISSCTSRYCYTFAVTG